MLKLIQLNRLKRIHCNNFISYNVLPAFNFHFIDLKSSQSLQFGITPERNCIVCPEVNYCFSLALVFIVPIMFACVFLINKHKTVKAFFACMKFLLSITKPKLLTNQRARFFAYDESVDTCNLLHKTSS